MIDSLFFVFTNTLPLHSIKKMPGWRNWQTHHLEGVARNRVSSNLIPGTNKKSSYH